MSDENLVDELRDMAKRDGIDLLDVAADEIERLRAEFEKAQNDYRACAEHFARIVGERNTARAELAEANERHAAE